MSQFEINFPYPTPNKHFDKTIQLVLRKPEKYSPWAKGRHSTNSEIIRKILPILTTSPETLGIFLMVCFKHERHKTS
jgi:hypothetical protein